MNKLIKKNSYSKEIILSAIICLIVIIICYLLSNSPKDLNSNQNISLENNENDDYDDNNQNNNELIENKPIKKKNKGNNNLLGLFHWIHLIYLLIFFIFIIIVIVFMVKRLKPSFFIEFEELYFFHFVGREQIGQNKRKHNFSFGNCESFTNDKELFKNILKDY